MTDRLENVMEWKLNEKGRFEIHTKPGGVPHEHVIRAFAKITKFVAGQLRKDNTFTFTEPIVMEQPLLEEGCGGGT